MFKKWDIIVIVTLILISFIPEIIFAFSKSKDGSETYADITVEGKLYKTIQLSSHHGKEELTVKTKYGFNIVQLSDNRISVSDADCRDKICVKEGYIYKPGQTIACIPHKIIIEIKSKSDDDIIITN